MGYSYVLSFASEGDSFSHLVELGSLLQSDGNLGVEGLAVLVLEVFLLDLFDGGVSVFAEDLGELEGERDALSHTLDLNIGVLFDDEFGQEQSLV